MILKLKPLVFAIATAIGIFGQANAQSLADMYASARSYDATYQSAKSQFDATMAKRDQAKAFILPKADLDLSASRSNYESKSTLLSSVDREFGTKLATISASQPLYRPANWASYEQGLKQTDLAQAQLLAAEQDLIIRVGQAYFDVLTSTDNLTFVKSQKAAVGEQLALVKRNSGLGSSTITDSREAQARYDLVIAQELAAENDLQVKSIALDQLVGKQNAKPNPLATPVVLAELNPANVDYWVRQSEANHPGIKQLEVALDVAKLETEKAVAGHKPTLDLVGSYGATTNNGSPTTRLDTGSNAASIGLSFNIPLFAGFSTQNRIKETLALEDKARSDLEAIKRTVAQGTRTAYFGVMSGLGQVKAYEAAEVSSQSALDATKLGYLSGVRTNIDVLNSQSLLFDTKAKLAKARYDVLLGELKLRQAAGTLQADNLQ